MSKADETIKRAVKDSLGVLREHVMPADDLGESSHSIDPQDSATLEKVTEILDNPTVDKAIEASDSARDDARKAAVSQHAHADEVKPDDAG